MRNNFIFHSIVLAAIIVLSCYSNGSAQQYTHILFSKQEICDQVINDGTLRFERNITSLPSSHIKILIPPLNVQDKYEDKFFLRMGRKRGDGIQVKLAMQYGQTPGNYASDYIDYTHFIPPQDTIRSIQDIRDEEHVIRFGGTGSEVYRIIYITGNAPAEGGGDWLYINTYSGRQDVSQCRVGFLVDREATINWCQGQQFDTGSLKVTIEPSGARSDGAQWRLTSGPDQGWKNSGSTVSGLDSEEYTVTFKEIEGWVKPKNISGINVEAGQTSKITDTYTEAGSIQVFIDPKVARDEGRWKITWEEEGVWHEHGYVREFIPPGEHNIEFKAVSGFDKPVDKTVIVEGTKTSSATGKYVPIVLPGVLMLLLSDDP